MSNGDGKFTHQDGVSLKEYFCSKIDSLVEKIELNFRLNQLALDKFEAKNEASHASMNEFRGAMQDQAGEMVSRNESELVSKGLFTKIEGIESTLESRIKALEISRAILAGKASQNSVILSYFIGVAGLALAAISLLIK
jgi:hypothetical protein